MKQSSFGTGKLKSDSFSVLEITDLYFYYYIYIHVFEQKNKKERKKHSLLSFIFTLERALNVLPTYQTFSS